MKANELMRYDWVCLEDDNTPKQVDWIRSGEVGLFWNQIVTPPYLKPIPLTKEILEKNGWKYEFDKTDYMVKYDLKKNGKNCWMMWAVKGHNLDIQRQDEKLDMYNLKISRVVIPCDYVHELQHALRLCGVEKTIEL